jgi:hypothetical protein
MSLLRKATTAVILISLGVLLDRFILHQHAIRNESPADRPAVRSLRAQTTETPPEIKTRLTLTQAAPDTARARGIIAAVELPKDEQERKLIELIESKGAPGLEKVTKNMNGNGSQDIFGKQPDGTNASDGSVYRSYYDSGQVRDVWRTQPGGKPVKINE